MNAIGGEHLGDIAGQGVALVARVVGNGHTNMEADVMKKVVGQSLGG